MAIIIPSKHLYSKSFNPVVDNNIDKIEVAVKDVSVIKKTSDEVFNGTYDNEYSYSTEIENEQLSYSITKYNNDAIGCFCYAGFYNHKVKRIQIKISSDNKKISSLNLGNDENGTPNIKVSYYGKIKTGYIDGTKWSATISTVGNFYKVDTLTKNTLTYKQQSEMSLDFQIERELSQSQFFNVVTGQFNVEAKTKLAGDNLSTVSATQTGNNSFILDLLVLTGVESLKFYSYNTAIDNPTSIVIPLLHNYGSVGDNEYKIYEAEEIKIAIYGNTIDIDLQDETITIRDGSKIFSFDGNELIQNTNTPTIESKYQSIIDNWKNGKQTATITCPIADYYDENGYLQKSQDKVKIQLLSINNTNTWVAKFKEINSRKIKTGDKLYLYTYALVGSIKVSAYDQNTGEFYSVLSSPTGYKVGTIYTVNGLTFDMLFYEGDIVIPYVYTNNGDIPLSYNKDFTPKQFKVIGTKIITQQGISQELTLLEI